MRASCDATSSLRHRPYALNAATGAQLWWNHGDRVLPTTPPTVSHGVVYLGARYISPGGNDYSEVAALNAATGTRLWSVPIGGAAESGAWIGDALAVANGVVYVGESGNGPSSSGGHLYVSDAATGTELWSSSLAASTPAVVNGVLYAASETNGQVSAFHLPRGQAAANRPSPTSLHPDYRLPTTT